MKNKIIKDVIEIINKEFKNLEINICSKHVDKALTGHEIGFDCDDLYSLYYILCKKYNKELRIKKYNDFYTIRDIANCISESI